MKSRLEIMQETTLDGLIREIRKAYDRMYAGGSEAELRASMAYCRGVIKALETQAVVDGDEAFALRLAVRVDDRIDELKNNAALWPDPLPPAKDAAGKAKRDERFENAQMLRRAMHLPIAPVTKG